MKLHKGWKDNKKYICHDCLVVFEIHGDLKGRRKAYCPNCADWINVKLFKEPPKGNYKTYTKEEEELLKKCVEKGIRKYRIAIIMGRTDGSIRQKINRMRAMGEIDV